VEVLQQQKLVLLATKVMC